jgi:hypothetical protein
MQDAETKTLWNHITGDAMHGPLVGKSVGPISNLLHMTASQALRMDAAMRVAISDQRYVAGGRSFGTAARGAAVGGGGRAAAGGGRGGGLRSRLDNPNATMADRFAATLGTEDARRPRMDIGLGIWTDKTARYYPIATIRERGDAFVDRIDGRNVLIYIERESNTPAALYVTARTASRSGEAVVLDDGAAVRGGVLVDRRGRPQQAQRPQQMFTRWYGFSLTFPGCEVSGG